MYIVGVGHCNIVRYGTFYNIKVASDFIYKNFDFVRVYISTFMLNIKCIGQYANPFPISMKIQKYPIVLKAYGFGHLNIATKLPFELTYIN